MYRQENRRRRFGSSKWKPEMVEQTYRYALLGATHKQLSEFFGVTVETIRYWLINNEEFANAFNKGKVEADAKVAEALYRKAVGYEYEETVEIKNRKGEVSRVETIRKYAHPDTTAALKWLAMRQRENWTDVSKHEYQVAYSGEVDIKYVEEQLKNTKTFSDTDLKVALEYSMDKYLRDSGAN